MEGNWGRTRIFLLLGGAVGGPRCRKQGQRENAWGSSRLLTELLCEDGPGVGIAPRPPPAQPTAHHAFRRPQWPRTAREDILL